MYLGFLFLPDARRGLAAYLLLFLAGSLLSLLAARSLSASRPAFVLLCAAAFRLTLLFRAPDLSPDVYRYLWDGRIGATGESPYAVAPRDRPDLFPDLQAHLAHREFRSVYPPAAQAAFRIGSVFSGGSPRDSVIALKALFASADVAVVALLAASSPFAAALYAFHPLPVTETAGQGHLDSLGVALLLAALLYVARGRRYAGGVAFAASALTKYVPLAASLPFARRGGWRFLAGALALGAALWAIASRDGVTPARGISEFATRWEFNSVAYPAVVAAVEAADLPARAKAAFIRWKDAREQRPWMQAVFPWFYTAFFARVALAILLAAALVVVAWRVRELELAVFASLAALLLLSPTLHPWYLLWLLPFAAKRREPAVFYLASAAPLAYGLLYPLRGWSPLAILAAEYVPFAGLLGITLWRRRTRT